MSGKLENHKKIMAAKSVKSSIHENKVVYRIDSI